VAEMYKGWLIKVRNMAYHTWWIATKGDKKLTADYASELFALIDKKEG
jgi:hypothetical protein